LEAGCLQQIALLLGQQRFGSPFVEYEQVDAAQLAHQLLEPVFRWFTEGVDTKDLLEAKSLLAELG
jgi:hypothetical protein